MSKNHKPSVQVRVTIEETLMIDGDFEEQVTKSTRVWVPIAVAVKGRDAIDGMVRGIMRSRGMKNEKHGGYEILRDVCNWEVC